MTVADLIEILQDANPEAPVFLSYYGATSDVSAVEIQNGKVYVQGY